MKKMIRTFPAGKKVSLADLSDVLIKRCYKRLSCASKGDLSEHEQLQIERQLTWLSKVQDMRTQKSYEDIFDILQHRRYMDANMDLSPNESVEMDRFLEELMAEAKENEDA